MGYDPTRSAVILALLRPQTGGQLSSGRLSREEVEEFSGRLNRDVTLTVVQQAFIVRECLALMADLDRVREVLLAVTDVIDTKNDRDER